VDRFIRIAIVLKGCTQIQPKMPPRPAVVKFTIKGLAFGLGAVEVMLMQCCTVFACYIQRAMRAHTCTHVTPARHELKYARAST
jgi:hypothetical protein